jgi:hypothetical protein
MLARASEGWPTNRPRRCKGTVLGMNLAISGFTNNEWLLENALPRGQKVIFPKALCIEGKTEPRERQE